MHQTKYFPVFILFLLGSLGCGNREYYVPNTENSVSHKIIDIETPSFQTAHPQAQKLLSDSFYWDPINETSPFGNDLGVHTYFEYNEWKQKNVNGKPSALLHDLINELGVLPFDINTSSPTAVKQYISTPATVDTALIDWAMAAAKKENIGNNPPPRPPIKNISDDELRRTMIKSASQAGSQNLVLIDDIIIALGFSQYTQDGKIDPKIKDLTRTAIERQLLPLMIETWPNDYKPVRKQLLNIMLDDVNKM